MKQEVIKTIGIIPARLESSRLPRKVLADICGLPMIVHVFRRCQQARELDEVYVATDNTEIAQTVKDAGGQVLMTRPEHETGTDRIAEACGDIDCDVVVNIQGDEALVSPEHIDIAVRTLKSYPNVPIVMPVTPFHKKNSISDIKVVTDEKGRVLYFSRADIPSDARTPNPAMLKAVHLMPIRKSFLLEYCSWPKGRLERIEFNEYLRILEKGYTIQSARIEGAEISVDTPEDLAYVRERMAQDPFLNTYQTV